MRTLAAALLLLGAPLSASTRTLTLPDFLKGAAANDSEFEAVLIDALALKYREDALLPARDIVLSVREELGLRLDGGGGTDDTAVLLSKLFPKAGTQLSASYDLNPVGAGGRASSALGVAVSQPIAENAFGKSTRLLSKIVGLEVEVARHQIIEAYEDYFAAIAGFYFDWYQAYENLVIARSSFAENSKLLDDMKARQRSKVAKQIDVDKVALQVLTRKERLLSFEERNATRLNLIRRALRDESRVAWVPVRPEGIFAAPEDRAAAVSRFREDGRSYNIVRRLEQRSRLETARELDDLLPSLSLFARFERTGLSPSIRRSEDRGFAGISLEFPFSNQVDRAQAEISRIETRKAALNIGNTDWRLRTALENLGVELDRERALWEVSRESIGLAQSVLRDESENYTYGKASLNDYIQAVNRLDTSRFSELESFVQIQRLQLEWLRLTDTLVGPSVLEP